MFNSASTTLEVIAAVVLSLLFLFLGPLLLKYLWNTTIPDITGLSLPEMTYWNALCLIVIMRILIPSCGCK